MTRELEADNTLLLTVAEAQSGNRWYHEQERLRVAFPRFRLVGLNGVITAAEGALDTQSGNTYGIRIDLTNFPYALPKIFAQGWTPPAAVRHKYADGSLCIMRAAQWRTQFSVALVVAKTGIWLAKYEIWKRNGNVWPGREQKH